MKLMYQDCKYPNAEVRYNFMEENFPEVNHERAAAYKAMDFILRELGRYSFKMYEQRDMALKCLEEGDILGAKEWLSKIGAIE